LGYTFEKFDRKPDLKGFRAHLLHIHSTDILCRPRALNNGIGSPSPLRYPYPGENGQRNNFRGDGYFDQDGGLAKILKTHEGQSLRLSWEDFNVSNTSRFDTSVISPLGGLNNVVTSGQGFGVYSHQLVQSRKQQFSLRYDF
jgi:hypothetical protein